MSTQRLIGPACATGLVLGLSWRNQAPRLAAHSRTAEVASPRDQRYWPEATFWVPEPGNSPSGNKEGSGSAAAGYRGNYRRLFPSAKDTQAADWPEAAVMEPTHDLIPAAPALELSKEGS